MDAVTDDAQPTQAKLLEKGLTSTSRDLATGFRYVVGVATLRKDPVTASPQLLVVKRAATETSFPAMFEIPGGHVEPGETIRQAVEREMMEETALQVDGVLGELEKMHWISRTGGTKNVQLNFVVTVKQPAEIRLNPEEHSEYLWADEETAGGLQATEAMRKVWSDAFTFARENDGWQS